MPPQGDQCIFCQLIDNPDQLRIVGETENFYAWLEYPEPRARGQTNVVPKEHVENIMDLGPEQYQEGMNLVREIMERLEEGLGADGITTAIHVNQTGGQMLDHVYIQVIPRYESDENAGTPVSAIFPKQEVSDDEYDEIQGDMDSVSVDFGVKTVQPHPDSQKFREKETDLGPEESEDKEQDDAEDGEEDFEARSYSWE